MQKIGGFLQTKIEGLKTKSNLSTEHQVIAVEVWEEMGKPSKRHELPILLRLAKNNLPIFKLAKQDLHAAESDGIVIRDRFKYFLWLIKYNKLKNK